ncbi:MAG TPA: DUF4437 domain-containing protein, partial [Kofleriaceae bacterium]|nr:DUF4437 domain-containing protein [Kofleriaceae bacterium]
MTKTKFQLASGAAVVAALAGGALAGPLKDIGFFNTKDAKWAPLDPKDTEGKGPQMSVVYGDPKAKGKPIAFFLKMPAGFKPGPHTHTSDYCALVVQGTLHDWKAPGTDEGPGVTVGNGWCQPGGQPHDNECEAASKDGCVALITSPGGFDF